MSQSKGQRLAIDETDDDIRTASLLAGKDGKERAENVWHEMIDALKKDVPETLELINT